MDTEIETLLAVQNSQRRHVLGTVEGLGEEDLRRPVLPSGWTYLGLISHLALDVERFWFRAVVAGERAAIDELAATANAWLVAPDVPAQDIVDRYRQQIDLADAVITGTAARAAPAWWPAEQFGGWRLDNVREILLHVITETACHAGHLDAARELIDGRLWLVLDGD
jgi:hypothetical protein